MRDLFRGGTRRRLASLTVFAVTGAAVVGLGFGTVSAAGAADTHHEPAPHVDEHHAHCIPMPSHHEGHWDHRFREYRRHHHHRDLPFCEPPASTTTTTMPATSSTTQPPQTTTTTEPSTTTTTVAVAVTTTSAAVAVTTTTADPPPTVAPTTTTTVAGPPPCPGVIVNGICIFVQ